MKNSEQLYKAISERILMLDGAMGTMIQRYNFSEEDYRGERFKDWESSLKGNNDLLSLTQPEAIEEIHKKYLLAGADIIETNTFGANRFKLTEHGLQHQVEAINRAAVAIARRVIDGSFRNVLLAGSLGPLGVRLAPLGRVSVA